MNTKFTNNPICPHCGHEEKDAWDIDFGPGLAGDCDHTCGSCGKDFFIERHYTVSYSTEIKKD